jgi:limonene-1,2-epoxide hydrolase
MQAKEFISKAVKILTEIEGLKEVLKELKADAKESELDVATLSAVANAIVQDKCDEVIEKSEAVIEAINLARS